MTTTMLKLESMEESFLLAFSLVGNVLSFCCSGLSERKEIPITGVQLQEVERSG
jgi:hypothetical protein